jgi:hypothetical protein
MRTSSTRCIDPDRQPCRTKYMRSSIRSRCWKSSTSTSGPSRSGSRSAIVRVGFRAPSPPGRTTRCDASQRITSERCRGGGSDLRRAHRQQARVHHPGCTDSGRSVGVGLRVRSRRHWTRPPSTSAWTISPGSLRSSTKEIRVGDDALDRGPSRSTGRDVASLRIGELRLDSDGHQRGRGQPNGAR